MNMEGGSDCTHKTERSQKHKANQPNNQQQSISERHVLHQHCRRYFAPCVVSDTKRLCQLSWHAVWSVGGPKVHRHY